MENKNYYITIGHIDNSPKDFYIVGHSVGLAIDNAKELYCNEFEYESEEDRHLFYNELYTVNIYAE